jgi:hypothetical protein
LRHFFAAMSSVFLLPLAKEKMVSLESGGEAQEQSCFKINRTMMV